MVTLTIPCSNFFLEKLRCKEDTGFLCFRDTLFRNEIHCFRKPTNNFNFVISFSFSLPRKSIIPISSLSSSSSHTQTQAMNKEPQIEDTNQSKTVHVKFELKRECSFGEHFLIVGDDPIFGCWDPSNAVPLNWSAGHIWTAELDIPVGRAISYKFILKAGPEKFLWQPGPDRVIQTWETKKRITICEDWDNGQLQKLIEADLTSLGNTGSTIDQETPNAEENLTSSGIEIPSKDDTDHVFGDNGGGLSAEDEIVPVIVPGISRFSDKLSSNEQEVKT